MWSRVEKCVCSLSDTYRPAHVDRRCRDSPGISYMDRLQAAAAGRAFVCFKREMALSPCRTDSSNLYSGKFVAGCFLTDRDELSHLNQIPFGSLFLFIEQVVHRIQATKSQQPCRIRNEHKKPLGSVDRNRAVSHIRST
jgi:hypothetical protein